MFVKSKKLKLIQKFITNITITIHVHVKKKKIVYQQW